MWRLQCLAPKNKLIKTQNRDGRIRMAGQNYPISKTDDFAALARFFDAYGYGSFLTPSGDDLWSQTAKTSGFLAKQIVQDNHIAAALLWRQAADEAEIIEIAVMDQYRRQGFGRALLDDFIADLRANLGADLASQNIKRIILEVAENNVAAIPLYAASGFMKIGKRANYYNAGQLPDGRVKKIDALILELWL